MVGGDFTQKFGQDLPLIDLELDITADPLLRLFHDGDQEQLWIDRRKAHLIETRVPRRPSPGLPDITRMWMETRDYDADRAKFDERLAEHLRECRSSLLPVALEGIYRSSKNEVVITACNGTDIPTRNVEIVVRFKPGKAIVLTSGPPHRRMPAPPKWPDITD